MARRARRVIVFALLAGVTFASMACAAFRYGYSLSSYQGQLLRTRSPAGSQALEIERGYDSTIDNYLSDKGYPDYIFVEDKTRVVLVYVARDELAIFTRGFRPESKLSYQRPIHQEALQLLEVPDQKRILDARAEELAARLGSDTVRDEPLPLADTIKRCYEQNTRDQPCDVGYSDGFLTMVFRSERDGEDAEPRLPGVATEFCLATNRANRQAIVLMRFRSRARSFFCELGKWSDWMDVDTESPI